MRYFFLLGLSFCLLALLSVCKAQDSFDGEDFPDPYSDGMPDPYGADPYSDMPAGGPEPPRQLTSVEEVDSFIQEDDQAPAIIGFFDTITNSEDLDSFNELAGAQGVNYRFAYTTEKSVLEAKKYDGCAVLVYPPAKFINEKFERTKHRFPAKSLVKAASNSLLQFIQTKATPLVGVYSEGSSSRYHSLQKPLVLVFSKVDLERNIKGYNYLANRVRKVATQYKDQYAFAIANVVDYMYELDKQYGVEAATDKNTYAGVKVGDTYYTMTDTFSLDNFSDFLKKFSAGQIEGKVHTPRKTSEEDAEGGSFYEGTDVVTLTKDNFASEVTNTNADVLVEFYAPWCGHCKHLKPEFIDAAETLAKDNGIKLAAMDATAHTPPSSFEVEGYPTLYFIPASTKKPVLYEGPREARGIVDYLKKHRTTKAGEL